MQKGSFLCWKNGTWLILSLSLYCQYIHCNQGSRSRELRKWSIKGNCFIKEVLLTKKWTETSMGKFSILKFEVNKEVIDLFWKVYLQQLIKCTQKYTHSYPGSSFPLTTSRGNKPPWKDLIWNPKISECWLNWACPVFKWMTNKLLGFFTSGYFYFQ